MAARPEEDQEVVLIDGTMDFSGGVNSYLTPTIASEKNPNGLKRNQLSWMNNATVRGGGITQRSGWTRLGALPEAAIGIYQGAFMYEPDSEEPYIIAAIGGHIWRLDPDNPSAGTDLSTTIGLTLPADLERYYFVQAEQFLVIQPGDGIHLPLIWDGTTLRKSLGLTGLGIEQIPGSAGTFVISNAGVENFTNVFPGAGSDQLVATNEVFNGAVGDLVFLVNGYTYHPPLVPGTVLVSYSVVRAMFQVIAPTAPPTNNVTLRLLADYTGDVAGVNFNATNLALWHLNSPPTALTAGTAEIPPATAMDYYMGRLWYAQGRQYSAGDIVGNQNSGTQPYNFRDSVLKVTENPLCIGGDGFTVPTNSGNIRAIKHSANINTQLGEGQLYIFTRRSIYSLTVPVTRNDWIAAGTNNQPRQTVVQITNGSVNDRSVAEQNGDLFYQSFEPSIRSLMVAVRNWDQWSNTPISINEDRILRFNDRSLMQFASGLSFDNRMLQLVLPTQVPVGVAHQAVIPLNFDVVSTLETKLPPVWEGMYEGLSMLQLLTGDFGGRQRCITPVWSEADRNIQLWEISTAERFENEQNNDGGNRVLWYIEFPAFTWGDEFMLKRLVGAELWVDRVFGEVMFAMDYRPDGDPCWYKWHEWKICTARDSCENVHQPVCPYPQEFCESFRQTMDLPVPPAGCVAVSGRPSTVGYQFQVRLSIKGFCRIRGLLLKATQVMKGLYGNDLVC